MTSIMQTVYDGTVIGMLYAVVGLGLVLIFRTTNVLNLGQGAIATFAGYSAWLMTVEWQWPFAISFIFSIAAGALLGAVMGAIITYLMADAAAIEKDIATLGFAFVLGWVNRGVFGPVEQAGPSVFDYSFQLVGVTINGTGILVVALCILEVSVVFYLLHRTRLGLNMRAVSQDADTARSYGISTSRVSLSSWILGSALGAASGVLVAAFIQIDHEVMIQFMIISLGALILGGFGSAVGAVLGGLVLGILSSGITTYISPSVKNTVLFGLIVTMLIIRPSGILGYVRTRMSEGQTELRRLARIPRKLKGRYAHVSLLISLVVIVFIFAPMLPFGLPVVSYSVVVATAIAVISLGTFTGYLGEISLGHGAFATIGAYVTTLIVRNVSDIPIIFPILLGGAGAALAGVIVGAATLRTSGMYFAIATLFVMYVVTEIIVATPRLTGGAVGLAVPRAHIFGSWIADSDTSVYYLALAILGIVFLATYILLRSRTAKIWVAIRDAPEAVSAQGINVPGRKIGAFGISAGLAGVAGAVVALVLTYVGPGNFNLHWLILMLLAVVIGGVGSLGGALVGAAIIVLVPEIFGAMSGASDLALGLTLLVMLTILPGGFPDLGQRIVHLARLFRRKFLTRRELANQRRG